MASLIIFLSSLSSLVRQTQANSFKQPTIASEFRFVDCEMLYAKAWLD